MADILSEGGQSILAQLREGILILDRDFRILSANSSFFNIFETTPGKIEGVILSSLASGAEDHLMLSSPVGEESVRVKLKTPTGRIVRTEMSFSPLLGQDSELNGYAVLVRNISAQALLEDKTRMMLEKYRDIALAGADWLWEIDSSGTYTYVSPSVERFLGYTPDDLFGRTPFDFMPKDEASRATSIFSSLSLTGAPIYSYQTRIITSSGTEKTLLTSGVPCYDSLGNLKGYRGSDRDITESVNASDGLKKSLAQTRMILEKLPVGVVLIDRDKIIRQINSTAGRITGMSPEEVVGKVCHKLMCPAMEGQCPILDLNQSIDRDEREVLHRDGRKIPVVKTVIPVKMDSEELLLEVFTDVSEITDVKSELRQRNAELQNALEDLYETGRDSIKRSRAKASLHGRFLSEIVASLSGISGYSELISPDDPEEQISDYLFELGNHVNRLSVTLDLLRDRQEGSWTESCGISQIVNPSNFRARLMDTFVTTAVAENVTFVCQVNDSLPDYMSGPAFGAWLLISEILGKIMDLSSLESILVGISSDAPSEPGLLCFSFTGTLEGLPESCRNDTEQLEADILKYSGKAESLGGRLDYSAGEGSGFVGMLFIPFQSMTAVPADKTLSAAVFLVSSNSHLAELSLRLLEKAGCSHAELFDPLSDTEAILWAGQADPIVLVIDADQTNMSHNTVQDVKIWIAKNAVHWPGDFFTVVLSSGAASEDFILNSGLEYDALLSKPVTSESFRKCFQLLQSFPEAPSVLITDFSI